MLRNCHVPLVLCILFTWYTDDGRTELFTPLVTCSGLWMFWALRWPETFLAVLLVATEAYRWTHGSVPGVVEAGWTTRRKLDTRYDTPSCIVAFNYRLLIKGTKFVTFGTMGTIITCDLVCLLVVCSHAGLLTFK